MIDTLRLNLTDCEIKANSPIIVQQPDFEHGTGKKGGEYDLFINSNGQIIKGKKAFLNDDKFNLTINPSMEVIYGDHLEYSPKQFHRSDYSNSVIDYDTDTDVTGIFLQTSLPRVHSESNLNTLTVDEQKAALKILEKRLRSYGIKTNIFNSKLSRVDTFTNVKTDLNFFSYASLFSIMDCSRMKSVGYADESFLWKNGQQELMIYDKVKEMKFKNPDLKIRKNNIMRFENRLLKKRKILSSLRFNNLSEMYNNFDDVKEFHKSEVGIRIFKFSFDEIQKLTDDDLKQKFLNAKKFFGKRWFDRYCFSYGAYQLSQLTSYEHLEQIIEDLEGSNNATVRKRKSRMKKSLREAKIFFNIAENKFNKFKSNVDLYNELKSKFYKLVA